MVVSRPKLPQGYGVPKSTKGTLEWSVVQQQLSQARNYWIASTQANGAPHIVPVWGVWLDDVLYFSTDAQTLTARNLAQNPAVAVHLESGDEVFIVKGTVTTVRGEPMKAINKAYKVKYEGGDPNAEANNAEGSMYAVRPRTVIAWTQFPANVTKWTF